MNCRRPISASASCRASAFFSRCDSSVTRQNSTIPTQANSTATPWISDHSQGFCWPAGVVEDQVFCQAEPTPWLTTVNRMLNRNGTQSW